jgi:hypothetical protein
MQLTFRTKGNSQLITLEELNTFETLIGKTLPQDYRQHMLTYNGGVLEQDVDHVNYPEGGQGISSFHPIKYGYYPMEELFEDLNDVLPTGNIAIGVTDAQGIIIMSLNNDSTYGNIREFFPDGDIQDLSSSFTQLLNDMVPSND